MPTLSIVTPWLDHAELIQGYERAVSGAGTQVILVDNGSRPDQAELICALAGRLGGVYLRNSQNLRFAAGNNQGLDRAEGDIVLFLNNDIWAAAGFLEAVKEDTGPGVMCGPALQSALVYGLRIPFLEGWCIAAWRQTWLTIGGWDAAAYPGPYWEDVDLGFRAIMAGIEFKTACWPVKHKGGCTTGPLIDWGESFEKNRATLAARVRPIYKQESHRFPRFIPGTRSAGVLEARLSAPRPSQPVTLADFYQIACNTPSDINEHCPTLHALAQECRHVTELGVRFGVSTVALLFAQPAKLVCYDRVRTSRVDALSRLAGQTCFVFRQEDVLHTEIEPTDLLLIDTWHVYEQLREELRLHAPKARKYIVLHDTTS